jgi:hypothetical protein
LKGARVSVKTTFVTVGESLSRASPSCPLVACSSEDRRQPHE